MPIISERITAQRRSCRELARLVKTCLLVIGAAFSANPQGPIADVVVSSETVPAGGTAQIKFSLARPQAIASGALSIDLDPEFFGDVMAASAFGAAGDAHGWATITGRHVEVQFVSASGAIGVVNGLPVVTVTAPILQGLAEGSKVRVTADPGISPWRNAEGLAYAAVRVASGTQTVGGTQSIREVQPSTGILPAGTRIRVLGTGFTASTAADIEGASVASVEFAGPEQIDITLAAPTEITGKRVRLRNPDDSALDFFSAWSADPVTVPWSPFVNARPILPLHANTAAESGDLVRRNVWLTVQNPNLTPVGVAVQTMSSRSVDSQEVFTIPAGAAVSRLKEFGGAGGYLRVRASSPVRTVTLWSLADRYTGVTTAKGSFSLSAVSVEPLQIYGALGSNVLTWQPGSAKPAPQTFDVYTNDPVTPARFAVSVTTDSGGDWLSIAPMSGTAGSLGTRTPVTVSVNPTTLSPGIYRGMFTLTPEESGLRTVEPSVYSVTLTVGAVPTTTNTVLACCFEFSYPSGAGLSYAYWTPPGVMPGAFSTSVATEGGGNWLSISPASGTHPSNFTIAANPANLPAGRYGGVVLITSSGGTIYAPVTLRVYGGVQLKPGTFALVFRAEAGKPPPSPVPVSVEPECQYAGCPATIPASIPWTVSVKTNSGGNWLSAVSRAGELLVSVNSASLPPGVYAGAVTLSSPAASGPTVVPVVLVIRSGPLPAIRSDAASLSLRVQSGSPSLPLGKKVTIRAGESEINFDASASTTDGGDWLGVSQLQPNLFGVVDVLYRPAGMAPGTYTGKVTVRASGQTLTIPVRLVIERPPQPLTPMLGSVVSAASAMPGPISPGEIVTIRGMGIGTIVFASYPSPALDPPRVFFDGIPAPVLFASPRQVNAAVPELIAGKTAATLELQYGYQSASWVVPVAAAAAGIFTLDSSGQGPAAVLNQDNSVNSSAKPAPRGSVIQIFATGIGERQQVTVAIGGIDAQVTFAGPAPGSVAGLFQVNAVVPPEVTASLAVPIVLAIGPYRSQDGVTIAVE